MEEKMLKGRCMKCKEDREMKNIKIEQTKRGGFMARAICALCGTKMCKMLSKADADKYK